MDRLSKSQAIFVRKYLGVEIAGFDYDAPDTETRRPTEGDDVTPDTTDTTTSATPATGDAPPDKAALLAAATAHGPLSGKGANAFPEAVREKLIAAYDKDPRLADAAVKAASTSAHPGAVADAFADIARRMQDGFKDAKGTPLPETVDARAYAEGLLSMGAHCGPDYFARLGPYLDGGGAAGPSGLGDGSDDSEATRVQKRSTAVARGLLDADGKLPLDGDGKVDLDTPGARAAIGNLLFHPDAMKDPTASLNAQVLNRLDTLFGDDDKGPKAAKILSDMTAPASGKAGADIVKGAVGGDGAADARVAVMSSMLKSFDQGPVGSCFATAPCRKMLEGDPLTAMGKLSEIASKGTLTPHSGIAVPAITNIPPGDDTLLRAMEYTYATAMARDANNENAKQLDKLTGRAISNMRTDMAQIVESKYPYSDASKLADALRDDLVFEYDAAIENQRASEDGKSSKGRFVVRSRTTGKQITSREDYVATATAIAVKTFGLEPEGDKATEMRALIAGDKFAGKLAADDAPPWMLSSGGVTAESTATIYGPVDETPSTAKAASPSDTPEKAGARTMQVAGDLLGRLGTDSPDMVVVRTTGIHAFNALPNHPSLKPVLEGPKSIAENLADVIGKAGETLAESKLDPDLAGWHFDELIEEKAKFYEKMSEDAKAKQDDFGITYYAERAAEVRKQGAAARPKAPVTGKELSDAAFGVLSNFLEDADSVQGKIAGRLANDLGVPQLVIADANWGDARSHTFFVVAPDPVTGQPAMWEKTEPPGTLKKMDKKWIDAEWAPIVPKPPPETPPQDAGTGGDDTGGDDTGTTTTPPPSGTTDAPADHGDDSSQKKGD